MPLLVVHPACVEVVDSVTACDVTVTVCVPIHPFESVTCTVIGLSIVVTITDCVVSVVDHK